MIINKKSWHYRVARKFGEFIEEYDNHDICTYSRKVMLGLLKIFLDGVVLLLGCMLFLGSPLSAVVWGIGYALGFFGPLAKDSFWDATVFAGVGILAVYIIISICALGKILLDRQKAKRNPNKVSFVAEAYRAWKGKYCAKVEFE